MWWKNGVIYQIYPRSFRDSNNDGIGDLRGIIEKLDYLNDGTEESLGVDGLWISPFFKSPMKDFGYDISDYRDIDPMFGTLEDFKLLLSEAHKRGIRIIIDLVLNHTSDEHPWFKESRKDNANPKSDWYLWHSGVNGKRPNNWFAQFELRNAWWYDSQRKQFYLGTFTRHQPELNWRNPQLRQEMFDIVRYWLEMGVDGFRLDVINWFIKDDQFRSNPRVLAGPDFQRHIYDRNRPETIEICKELRAITDAYTERMMVGEVFANDPAIAASYHGENGDGLHMAFNFNFLFQPWDARRIYESIQEWYENLPPEAWPNFTFSNHDNLRHFVRYGNDASRARVAAMLLVTLRGTPFIYYGEELGMTGGNIKRSELVDPLSKKTWPLRRYRRDLARTPMQWDASAYAGFSEHKPWLPVDKDYAVNHVDAQARDKGSLLSFYKKLIWLRKRCEALQMGDIKFMEDYLPNAIAYIRELNQQRVLVVLNFSKRKLHFHLNDKMLRCSVNESRSPEISNKIVVLLGSHRQAGDTINPSNGIALMPDEALMIELVDMKSKGIVLTQK